MNRYFIFLALILITLFLTGCTETVEQRTLTCSQDGETLIVVYEEDRLISYSLDSISFDRETGLGDILFLEESILDEYTSDNFFDIMDDANEEFSEQGTTCTITSEEVKLVEYDEDEEVTSTLQENVEKDSVLADAIAIEMASKLYCSQTTCDADQQLTWTQLENYVEGIDATYYDFTNNTGILTTRVDGEWTVDMEVIGTGEWEFTEGLVPTDCDRTCVIRDID